MGTCTTVFLYPLVFSKRGPGAFEGFLCMVDGAREISHTKVEINFTDGLIESSDRLLPLRSNMDSPILTRFM